MRRTYREGGKVKNETVGNLSHLPEELVELVRRSLAGERFLVSVDAFEVERSLPHGHVAAVLGTLRKLGPERLLGREPSRERDLVVAMVCQRLLRPGSKLSATRQFALATLGEELAVEGRVRPSCWRRWTGCSRARSGSSRRFPASASSSAATRTSPRSGGAPARSCSPRPSASSPPSSARLTCRGGVCTASRRG